jgi:peptidoglycan/xylan/chitin deacetylase (PgdA/CDA1 family)
MSARIFIRNDDPWRLDKEFRTFFDIAMEAGVPVVHAVIPGKMEEDFVDFLRKAKDKTPHLLDIVQHGWNHSNYSVTMKKYEFGPSRSLNEQRHDIRQGLERMRAAFGEQFTPAFVPPFHGFDANTEQVVKQEQFRIFSAGSRGLKDSHGLIELPVKISMSFYGWVKPVLLPADTVVKMLVKHALRNHFAGLVTHHADFKTAAARKDLQRLFQLIAALIKKQEWQTVLFSDILREQTHD